MGGEYEEDDDDESWHGAREDGRETATFERANDGTRTEPEGESEGLIRGGEVGNRHDRFGWDAIQAWIGWSRRDRGGNGKETREGSSTPGPETSAVRPLWQRKIEEKEGGGEGTRATTDKGAGQSDYGITEDVRGQAGQEGVPRNGTAVSEVAENSEVKSTDAEVGVTAGEGRGTEHALRPAEGQGTSMHPKERQRVTDDDGRVKPLRGKRGMTDGTTRHQDRRHGPSAIGMSGEWCL
jgi:hypothetical protein